MTHNAADITALYALGFRLAIWRSGGTAWVDLIPHRGASLAMGIRGQFTAQALHNRLNRVLA
jgi:hypothetical protein